LVSFVKKKRAIIFECMIEILPLLCMWDLKWRALYSTYISNYKQVEMEGSNPIRNRC